MSLAEWTVEDRPYGIGTCMGGRGPVLCKGKWGVVGSTGQYRILFPTGWIEDKPMFQTEIEAMNWVDQKCDTQTPTHKITNAPNDPTSP